MAAASTLDPTTSTSPSSSGRVCAACGLCCNGTFFARVYLHAHEVAGAKRLRLRVVPFEDREVLDLPCSQHTGTACGIYEARPASCAEYRCGVLQDANDCVISEHTAISRVVEMKALATRIRAALPPETADQVLFEAAEALFAGEAGAAWRRQHAALLLDMAVFLRRCKQEFGVGDKPAPTSDPPGRA